MKYTVDYFIGKFESIPENQFTTGRFEFMGARCFIGHTMTMKMILRVRDKFWFDQHKNDSCFNETRCLCGLIKDFFGLDSLLNGSLTAYSINNGSHPNYKEPTPKKRILAALYDIKKSEQSEVKERVVYVSFCPKVKELMEVANLN